MSSLCVSIHSRKDICSVLFMQGGRVVLRDVSRILDEQIYTSMFESMLYCMTKALTLLRSYLAENEVTDVIFECNNSTFIKWVQQGFSKDRYQESFVKVYSLLDEIPMLYKFCCNKKPRAALYANENYLPKLKLSGLDVSLFGDD